MNVYFIYRGILSVYVLTHKHTFIFSFTRGNVYGSGSSSSYPVICSKLVDISPFHSLNFWHLIQAVCLQMIHAWRYK